MSNQEPESYDLNSMMDRLRSRNEEVDIQKGELVTRADGSQAIRVRKRKRRTEQPHKTHQKRVRIIQVTAALVLLLVVLLTFGFLMVYVNSSPFHKKVELLVAGSTRAESQISQFRMNPTSANAMGLDLIWPAGNMLDSASFKMLRAKVSPVSFFGSRLSGQELEAVSGTLVLKVPQTGMPRGGPPLADAGSPIQFTQYGVKNLGVMMMVDERVVVRLDKSEASWMPPQDDKPSKLILSRGDLQLARWPGMRLDRALVEFPGNEVNVVSLRAKGMEDAMGFIELKGRFDPYEANMATKLNLSADAFQISDLVGSKLGGLFSGRVDSDPEGGPCDMRMQLGVRPEANMVLTFKGTPATVFQVKNFPFLYSLAHMLDDPWFSQPEFEDVVRGTLVRTTDKVQFQEFDFSSKKRMHLRGNLEMDESLALSGTIRLGVDHGMISTSKNKVLDEIFGPGNDGFRWLTLEISGTAIQPKDNLNQLYDQALTRLGSGEGTRKPASEVPTFEDLTAPR